MNALLHLYFVVSISIVTIAKGRNIYIKMEGFNFQQIKELQHLLAHPKDESDSDSDDDLRQRLSRQKISKYINFHSFKCASC